LNQLTAIDLRHLGGLFGGWDYVNSDYNIRQIGSKFSYRTAQKGLVAGFVRNRMNSKKHFAASRFSRNQLQAGPLAERQIEIYPASVPIGSARLLPSLALARRESIAPYKQYCHSP